MQMDSILEQFSGLKIQAESKVLGQKLEENLKKTGVVYEPDNFDYSETLKKLYQKLTDSFSNKYQSIKGRSLNEEEETILKEKLSYDSSSISVLNNKTLGSSLEVINEILNQNIENGAIFLNENKDSNDPKFETINILTQLALEKHNLKRILIIDLNIDSNINIQEKFYGNSKVIYFSIHRFINGLNSIETNFDFIGDESAKGFNINVVLNNGQFGNNEYLAIFYNILLPIAYEFAPELILIPSKFDATETKLSDNLINISPLIYAHFLHSLSSLADGKILLLINGSDTIESFPESVLLSLRTLLGYPCPRISSLEEPKPECIKTILNSISVLRPYWCCIQLLNDNDSINLNEFLESCKIQNNELNVKSKKEDCFLDSKKNLIETDVEILKQNLKTNDLINRTCICSDEAMMQHFNLITEHPEKPDRIKRIIETLKEKNLYQRCEELKSRYATDEELEICHSKDYVENIKSLKEKTTEELKELSRNPHSVFYHSSTFECASLATGCLLSVVDQICTNKCLNGVGIIRPPGHHAHSDSCSGFCFFNSIAIAAKYAQKKYSSVKKVLILDFDVHHGNGTQSIFEDDNSVLFISLHRYDNGNFYPVDAKSNYTDIGINLGKGFTINIPWNQQTAGDAEYVAAFLRVVMPVAYQFNPDLVLVSAGFDGAQGDPLGRFNITPSGFAQMTKMLSSLANGNLILGLEGGYNLTSISESMSACVSILLGDMCPSIPPIVAKPKAYESIKNVISVIKNYWSFFKFDEKLPNCDFQKSFKSDRKNNNKNNFIEIPYSLRNRNKSNDEKVDSNENSDKKENNKNNKKSSPKSSASSTASSNLHSLNEDSADGFPCEFSTPFSVVPLPFCPHLLEINKNINKNLVDVHRPCVNCQSLKENWICLSCFECACSRFIKGHMSQHYEETKHPMVLSFSDLSVWCYVCDSYVHNDLLTEVKQLAYTSKFG